MARLIPASELPFCPICGQPVFDCGLCDDCWWSLHEEERHQHKLKDRHEDQKIENDLLP